MINSSIPEAKPIAPLLLILPIVTLEHTSYSYTHKITVARRNELEASLLLYARRAEVRGGQVARQPGEVRAVIHSRSREKAKTCFSYFICVGSIVLLGSCSAESDPVITCQLVRLGLPRARATEPERDPRLRRGVHADPLRAPQPGARQKTRGQKRKAGQFAKEANGIHIQTTCILNNPRDQSSSAPHDMMSQPTSQNIGVNGRAIDHSSSCSCGA